jgi:hypothetical protein
LEVIKTEQTSPNYCNTLHCQLPTWAIQWKLPLGTRRPDNCLVIALVFGLHERTDTFSFKAWRPSPSDSMGAEVARDRQLGYGAVSAVYAAALAGGTVTTANCRGQYINTCTH